MDNGVAADAAALAGFAPSLDGSRPSAPAANALDEYNRRISTAVEALAGLRDNLNMLTYDVRQMSRDLPFIADMDQWTKVHWTLTAQQNAPAKRHVWASDGVRVWLIHTGAEGISKHAVRCIYWTDALIPLPPIDAAAEAR